MMTGTEKQVAWAMDIKEQVNEKAHEVYEAGMEKQQGLSFEQSPVGHAVVFAEEHFTEAKQWIDAIGYSITDYDRRSESAKSRGDLERIIIDGLRSKILRCESADLYCDEEKELKHMRFEALRAYHAAKKAARAN